MTQIQASRENSIREANARNKSLAEEKRSNRAKERETTRHNRQTEGFEDRSVRTKERLTDLEEQLSPYKKADYASKVLKNTTGALKDGVSAGMQIAYPFANDWTWYFHDLQRMRDSLSLPIQNIYGGDYSIYGGGKYQNAPGVVGLLTEPTIGEAVGPNSPIQRAANALFIAVNANTGRNSNYEAADLMLTSLATYSFHSWVEELKRAYRLLFTHVVDNTYIPRAIMYTAGFDYDDLKTNIYAFKGYINYLEDVQKQFMAIPNASIRARWDMESSMVFRDGDTNRTQFYMFVHSKFFRLDYEAAGGTALRAVSRPLRATYEEIVEFSEYLLSAFVGYSDYNTMKADLMKYYGDSAVYNPVYITSDVAQEFTYDPLVLTQIANASLNLVQDGSTDITQVDGSIVSEPRLKNTYLTPIIQSIPVRVHANNRLSADEASILLTEATRLTVFTRPVDEINHDEFAWAKTDCPYFGFVTAAMITTKNPSDPDGFSTTTISSNSMDVNKNVWADQWLARVISALWSFDYFPSMWIRGSTKSDMLPIFDWDQYFIITPQILSNANQISAYRLFGNIEV